jgi:cell division protein FtsW (lipid II flippase)
VKWPLILQSPLKIAKVNCKFNEKGRIVIMHAIQLTLFILICLFLGLTLFYSIRSRRESDAAKRGLYTARMNICMGLMLVLIAITQIFFFSESSFRRIFGTVLVLIGVFNVFVGIRNHGHFDRLLR